LQLQSDKPTIGLRVDSRSPMIYMKEKSGSERLLSGACRLEKQRGIFLIES